MVRLSAPRTLAVCTVVAGAVFALANACSPNNTPSTAPANSVTIRVINVAPAVPIDVSDSTKGGAPKAIFNGTTYLSNDTTKISEGGTWYMFNKAGGSPRLAVAGSAEFLATYGYDVFVADSGTTPTFQAQVLPTVEPDTVSSNTKIRVVNVLPTPTFPGSAAGGYDLYVTAPGTSLTTVTPTVAALLFGLNTSINSGPTYLSETPGATEIRLIPNADTIQADVIIDSTITLTAGQGLTLFATQKPGGVAAAQLFIVRDH